MSEPTLERCRCGRPPIFYEIGSGEFVVRCEPKDCQALTKVRVKGRDAKDVVRMWNLYHEAAKAC